MTRLHITRFLLLFSLSSLGAQAATDSSLSLAGSWVIDRQASSAIDPWSVIELEISVDGEQVSIVRTVKTGRRTNTNTYALRIGTTVPVDMGWWTGNRHIGAYVDPGSNGHMRAEWLDGGSALRVESWFDLVTSQGSTAVRTYAEYRLSADGETLTRIALRSTRNKPIVEVYRRS